MRQGDRQRRRRDGNREQPPPLPDEQEQRGEHDRDEQLPRRGRRQRERVVGAAVARCEPGDRHLPGEHRDPAPDRVEERTPRLEDDDERDRDEDRRLVEDDVRRVDPGQLRDEREEPMPEREGVAGMRAAVRELAHRVDRQLVERLELPHPGQVEQRVAAERRPEPPDEDGEHRPDTRNRPGNPVDGDRLAPHRERQRDRRCGAEHDQRQQDRRPESERREHPQEEDAERQRDRLRDGRQAQRTSDQRAGDEQAERGRGQPEREPEPLGRKQARDRQQRDRRENERDPGQRVDSSRAVAGPPATQSAASR